MTSAENIFTWATIPGFLPPSEMPVSDASLRRHRTRITKLTRSTTGETSQT